MKLKIIATVILAMVTAAGLGVYSGQKKPASTTVNAAPKTAQATPNNGPARAPVPATNYCAGSSGQNIIVSISKQHLWACDGTTTKYDSAVITGMEQYPADLTPTGTYQIYAKATNQTLTGSDSTGSWSDPVSYWEPFLSNKYGVYGFHDASWRANADFGKVDINAPFTTTAKSASHGCVELPLATAKWLYNWSNVGTTVSIQT